MSDLTERIQSEADIASRPGQGARLEAIAAEVAEMESKLVAYINRESLTMDARLHASAAADHCDACNNHPARRLGVANEKCCTCCQMPDGSRPGQGVVG